MSLGPFTPKPSVSLTQDFDSKECPSTCFDPISLAFPATVILPSHVHYHLLVRSLGARVPFTLASAPDPHTLNPKHLEPETPKPHLKALNMEPGVRMLESTNPRS